MEVNNRIKLIGKDKEFLYFKSEYNGQPVRMKIKISTGECFIDSTDFARCYGFNNMIELLSSDAGLDAITIWKEKHPDRPLIGENGMFESEQMQQIEMNPILKINRV